MKALLGFAVLLLPLAADQIPNPPNPQTPVSDARITVEVPRVPLLFTVTDRRGRFVTDLDESHFRIFDDGKPQKILTFSRESDLPLRIGILIDTSNSIRDRLRFQQEAAIEFIRSVLKKESDRAFLVSYDIEAELVVDFTNDVKRLAEGVRSLRAGGGTALYDAIYFACRDKLASSSVEQVRRALVVLGDGDDNQSRFSREQALEMAHRAEVVIFTISTNPSGVRLDGDRVLQRFSEQTGGLSYQPFQAADLARSFANIADELRHQYFLLYAPHPFLPDGRFREIEVRTAVKDLRVRTRRGYYAPRQ
jgi:Ca-activated chloride channel family protein